MWLHTVVLRDWNGVSWYLMFRNIQACVTFVQGGMTIQEISVVTKQTQHLADGHCELRESPCSSGCVRACAYVCVCVCVTIWRGKGWSFVAKNIAAVTLSLAERYSMYHVVCVIMATFIHACRHACVHAYIHTYIHTYIKIFHGSISLSQESRMWNKSYTYVKIFTTFRCILTRHFYMSSAHSQNSTIEQNECVFRYLFRATLKFAYIFLRFVSLRGKVLNIPIPEYASGLKSSRPRP